MLDFRIDTFLTVCKYMNYTKAADVLHITQPAVSQHIKFLEAQYNQKLFQYEGKKLKLTKAGHLLYQACTTMKSDFSLLTEQMQTNSEKVMHLSLGVTLTIGEFVIASHLKQLLLQYPNASFQLTVANTSELLQKLKSDEIQFALIEGSFPKEEFDSMVYSRERFIPVCNADHTFHTAVPHSLSDLTKERIIIREPGSGTREILESNLHLQNLFVSDFAHSIEINGMHTIKSMVLADLGITFLYETAVKSELENGFLMEIQLDDFHVSHDFSFIWNKNSIFSDTYRNLCLHIMPKSD